MQHGCDFITRKFAAFKDGVVTNNTSESMNNILRIGGKIHFLGERFYYLSYVWKKIFWVHQNLGGTKRFWGL